MKVLSESIVRYDTGDMLPPDDVNRPFLYAADAIDDVAERRWAKSVLSLPFVESVSTPYTQATNAEVLKYRFKCPVQCVVERAFLNANMAASGAPAEWSLKTGVTVPAGATNPVLTTRGAIVTPSDGTDPSESADGTVVATSTTTAQNNERALLLANTEYELALQGSTFSCERADVALHIAVDRWLSGGSLQVPALTPTLLRSIDPPDADVVVGNQTKLATEAVKFASNAGMVPLLFVRHGLTSTTDVDLRTFRLPRFASARGRARVVRIYSWAVMSAAATATIGVQLRNSGGGIIATANISLVAATTGSGDSGALSLSLTNASASTSTTAADDYTVVLDSSTATNALKVYTLVWVAWS
jgi:hypothetical protein